MEEYKIKLKLISDTMFGSGESLPGVYDSDILSDKYGIPYMKAKTFKGHVREKMEELTLLMKENNELVDNLLGAKDVNNDKKIGCLKFSDFTMSESIRELIANEEESKNITYEEVINAFTTTNTFIKINKDGVAEPHSLRRIRMVQKDLIFYSKIYSDRVLNYDEERILVYSLAYIQHIGGYKSKGKGVVMFTIYKDNEDLTSKYLKGEG